MRRTIGLAAAVLTCGLALAGDAKTKDWKPQMGDLPFVVGFDKGRAEVKFTGKPAMFFFTSAIDDACTKFGARTWKDKAVLAAVAGYTPVIIDGDVAPKEVKEKYAVKAMPLVAWTDFDENPVASSPADAEIEAFRTSADTAKEKCPAAKPPADGLAPLLELKKKLDAAKDVKSQLAAIAEIKKVGLGAGVQAAAAVVDAKIADDGEAEVGKAKGMLAARKKPEAKKVLDKIVDDYPPEHRVAKEEQDLLDQLSGKTKPKK